ncbi:hypothetical protein P4S67_12420 [Pseudoalteromonas sp. B137]
MEVIFSLKGYFDVPAYLYFLRLSSFLIKGVILVGFLGLIAFIWFVSAIAEAYNKNKNNQRPTPQRPYRSNTSQARSNSSRTSNNSSRPRYESQSKENTQTFRPKPATQSKPKISFQNTSNSSAFLKTPTENDLKDLHDAFTGAVLNKALGLYQCFSCKVYYHKESLQVLKEVNSSKCVSCHSTNIVEITDASNTSKGKDYSPSIITLSNYKEHVGSVVTFEGLVQNVRESKRGNDFAVMFENKSWVQGFKLVFFRGAVRKVGGKPYINSLNNKKLRVRGLLIKHEKFGYEIIVSEKSMIMDAK